MRLISVAVAGVALATPAAAFQIGSSEFVYSSDLMAQGYEVFSTSGVGNAIFGMKKDTDLYICFIADRGENQAMRQTILIEELAGNQPNRTIPNIPVICILTQ